MKSNSDIKDGDPDWVLLKESSTRNITGSYLRMVGFFLFFALCIAILHFTPIKGYITDLQNLKAFVNETTGHWGILLYVALTSLSIFLGVPRLPFCVLGGMLFGFINGLLFSQIATMAGSYGPYLLGRYCAHDWIKRKITRLNWNRVHFDNPTVMDVFLFRQIPVWGLLLNLFIGSMKVSHMQFMLGSLLGFLPQAIIFTLMGSGLMEESFLNALSKVWGAMAVLLFGGFIFWKLNSRTKKKVQDIPGD